MSNLFLLIFLGIMLIFLIPVFHILSQVKQFLISVETGNAFIQENVRRFRIFGIIAIVLALLAGIFKFIAGFYVSSSVELPSNLAVVHSLNLGNSISGNYFTRYCRSI